MRSRLLACAMSVCAGMTASTLAQGRQATPPPAGTKPAPAAAAAAGAATNNITVTVNYTGKGTVDANHTILLFLFSTPNVGPQSEPLGPPQIATKNGAVLTFKDVKTTPVYVVAIYNEKGPYDGRSGPPAAGTPIATYSKDAKGPTAVTAGPKTAIRMSFNDSKRWGQ